MLISLASLRRSVSNASNNEKSSAHHSLPLTNHQYALSMASAAGPTHGAGLLGLPAELRNHIFALLKEDTHIPEQICTYDKDATAFPFAVTRVNRQTRAETAAVFYHGIDIKLDMWNRMASETSAEWVKLMHPDALAAVSSVTLSAFRGGLTDSSTCIIKTTIESREGSSSWGKRETGCWVRSGDGARVTAVVADIIQQESKITKAVLLKAMEAVIALASQEQQTDAALGLI